MKTAPLISILQKQLLNPYLIYRCSKFFYCIYFLLSGILFTTGLCAQKTSSNISIDSLPESQLDIPIRVNLRPLYSLAEKNVDTVFTSPDYPNSWIQPDCATRYKYHFRRSPLKISMNGSTLDLSFTGYYQIIGSTRACMNGTVVSPWTPPCRCGFEEAERKVEVGFSSTFRMQNNYILNSGIIRKEPRPLDKCSVCFWGQDITSEVMKGLKAELDASKKLMEDSFRTVSLRPYVQKAWDLLNEVYTIPNLGYFTLHPKKLRMENIHARNDFLNISIGISATPVISFARPEPRSSTVPDLTPANNPAGFNIYLEAALQYDSLSRVLNNYLFEKRIDVAEGILKKHIIIKNAAVSGDEQGNMVIRLDFSGSFDGTVYFTGRPGYDTARKSIVVQDLDYDLKTRNLLLKTAKWLFNKRISGELEKYTSFELSQYYDTASKAMNGWLNREWTKGISGTGSVKELKLTSVQALPEHLLIRSNCTGNLSVLVSELNLRF